MNILQLSWGYGVLRHFEQCFRFILAVSFVDGGNQSKMTDLPQVTDHDKHNVHIMLYRVHLAMNRIRTHNVSDDRQQAIQKCSSRSTEKVFLFGEALNPRWPPWPLIGPDI